LHHIGFFDADQLDAGPAGLLQRVCGVPVMASVGLNPILLAGRGFAEAYQRLPAGDRERLLGSASPRAESAFRRCLEVAERVSGWPPDAKTLDILEGLVTSEALDAASAANTMEDLGTFFRHHQGFVNSRLSQPILVAADAVSVARSLGPLLRALPEEGAKLDFGLLLRDLHELGDGVRRRWIEHRFR
jgi:hypothetical protein